MRSIGSSDACQRQQFVIVVPSEARTHESLGLGVKGALLAGFLVFTAGFAAIRSSLTESAAFHVLLINTIGQSLGVGVPVTDASRAGRPLTAAVLRGALNAFALVFTSIFSGWLFQQYMAEERSQRRIRRFEDLYNDTLRLSLPMGFVKSRRYLIAM